MGLRLVCDSCGKEYLGNVNASYGHSSVGSGGRTLIRQEAVEDGWECDRDTNHDICPECKDKEQK